MDTGTISQDRIYSLGHLATVAGVEVEQLEILCKRGQIRSFEIAGATMVLGAAVFEYGMSAQSKPLSPDSKEESPDSEYVLTVQQLDCIISRNSLKAHIKQGLPYKKSGQTLLFSKSTFNEYFQKKGKGHKFRIPEDF